MSPNNYNHLMKLKISTIGRKNLTIDQVEHFVLAMEVIIDHCINHMCYTEHATLISWYANQLNIEIKLVVKQAESLLCSTPTKHCLIL